MNRIALKWLKIAAGVLITALSLWLSFRKLEWTALVAAISRANMAWVTLAVALTLLTVYIVSWRWQILLGLKENVSANRLFRLNILSQYVNIIMPGRFGELLRAYLLSKESSVPGGYAIGTIAIEKIFDFLMFVALWITVPIFFAFQGRIKGYSVALFFCLLIVGLLILIVWHPEVFRKCLIFFTRFLPDKLKNRVLSFTERAFEAFDILKSVRALAGVVLLTFLSLLGQILPNYFLFLAFRMDLTLLSALFLLLALQVGNLPPSVPGKIGVFEYAVILALSVFNVSKSQALSYGIMLHIVAFLPKILLGTIFIGTVDLKKLKLNMRQTPESPLSS